MAQAFVSCQKCPRGNLLQLYQQTRGTFGHFATQYPTGSQLQLSIFQFNFHLDLFTLVCLTCWFLFLPRKWKNCISKYSYQKGEEDSRPTTVGYVDVSLSR
ncbi:hypothetical protein T10_4963 [Trichinella papuae]|uniref:Uncharacterized protein n=1 Tax=Trichinella papuae TaxID=268474 RepID=A0A0V1MRT8_9BILA|nr:hypothetical protein T10_4963 [Trichinella papuae]